MITRAELYTCIRDEVNPRREVVGLKPLPLDAVDDLFEEHMNVRASENVPDLQEQRAYAMLAQAA